MPSTEPINSLEATRPDRNATVSASAGSGKTWLLVTRIIRLLLAGAEPGGILALTFTRKAAAEMQLRLQQRLLQMASADDSELEALLQQAGVDGGDDTRQRARRLYENLLHAPYPPRTLTFHAFCQEILAFFPLEAGVPPGFELIEDTAMLQQQAWEALFADATQNPQQHLANDLDVLMQACNGPANTRTALNSLLAHRNDWWACTENANDPAAYASRQLQRHLQIDDHTDPYALFFERVQRDDMRTFAALLQKHAGKTNLEHADKVFTALETWRADADTLSALQPVFLTQQQQPRSRKSSKAQAKSMGAEGEQTFLDLHARICDAMLHTLDLVKRQQTLALNAVWYRIGQTYIDRYQRLKSEQRLLDFTDLEWNCYRLLSASDNALWVQYRIDRRIDHVLIDEFQDTNPTQWQLITPLLEEIAAGDDQRRRSIFLVGDEKQSIYSFRRANPALQAQASDWLARSLSAVAVPLDASRRSSPAIIDAVNGIFGQDEVRAYMPGFSRHDTYLRETPGSVTLLPLCAEVVDENDTASTGLTLRNPLLQPREIPRKTARLHEAQLIADSIEAMLAKRETVVDENGGRALDYGDIMILLRNRTHLHEYEAVLRERGIPFIGSQRGSLLDNQEIHDLETLLDSLITPYHNLSIAQILKSPVFAASDEDLVALATMQGGRRWFERLQTIAADREITHPLARASRLLLHWRALADTVPVHDLLDRIYAEGNIIARYAASVPEHQRYRVTANLQRFLELSLELDSGRYPSLSHFLHYLRSLRDHADSPPDEPASSPPGSQLRIMTIHASKGLEAPVVFLADCNNRAKRNNAYTALVDWPADSERPVLFQLVTGAQKTDSITEQLQQRKDQARHREELNLLYVALTRARQHLVISGVEAETQHSSGWFDLIRQGLLAAAARETNGILRLATDFESAQNDSAPLHAAATAASAVSLSPELKRPITQHARRDFMIAPSYRLSESRDAGGSGANADDDGATRGIVIHRALELLSRDPDYDPVYDDDQLLSQISAEAGVAAQDPDLLAWLDEARGIHRDDRFTDIFRPGTGCRSYNEMPLLYRHEGRAVYGLVDRLVVGAEKILLIDYKTRRCEAGEDLSALAMLYREQLRWYRLGVEKLWPGVQIKTALLFTSRAELVWMPAAPVE